MNCVNSDTQLATHPCQALLQSVQDDKLREVEVLFGSFANYPLRRKHMHRLFQMLYKVLEFPLITVRQTSKSGCWCYWSCSPVTEKLFALKFTDKANCSFDNTVISRYITIQLSCPAISWIFLWSTSNFLLWKYCYNRSYIVKVFYGFCHVGGWCIPVSGMCEAQTGIGLLSVRGINPDVSQVGDQDKKEKIIIIIDSTL